MSITGLENVTSAAGPLSSPGSDFLGKDAFLYMFISQLRAQDPLNPMESTEFTAQLAQFSSLEQLSNVNANLEFLQLYQASINNSQAVGFIGKTISALGNSTRVADGVADQIHFELEHNANDVLVHIYDSGGNLLKTIDSGALNAGEHSVEWDGTDNEGNQVPDGTYTFEVVATNTEGNPINAKTYITVLVSGVSFKDGTTYLLAGDQEIAIGSVFKVMGT
jgi:flagellar basal-body rod modification protein FlgD